MPLQFRPRVGLKDCSKGSKTPKRSARMSQQRQMVKFTASNTFINHSGNTFFSSLLWIRSITFDRSYSPARPFLSLSIYKLQQRTAHMVIKGTKNIYSYHISSVLPFHRNTTCIHKMTLLQSAAALAPLGYQMPHLQYLL